MPLPANRVARITIGVGLILLGLLGFLPVLGFWMVPLGLLILSGDLPAVRRWRRRLLVRFGGWLKREHPSVWQRVQRFFNGNVPNGNGNGVAR